MKKLDIYVGPEYEFGDGGRRFVYFEEKDRLAEQRHDGDKTNHSEHGKPLVIGSLFNSLCSFSTPTFSISHSGTVFTWQQIVNKPTQMNYIEVILHK